MKFSRFFLALFLGCCCLGSAVASALSDTERWTYHLSYHDGSQAIRTAKQIFFRLGDNLLIYDRATQQLQPITRLSHDLAAKRITQMAYSESQDWLVLLYADRNIDLFSPTTERVVHLPYLKNSNTADLTIRRLNVYGDNALLATSEGVVWIDLRSQTVRGRYLIGDCADAAIWDKYIFAASSTAGLRCADLTSNPSDPSNWQSVMSEAIGQLVVTPTALYATGNAAQQSYGAFRLQSSATAASGFEAQRATWNAVLSAHYDSPSQQLQLLDYAHLLLLKPEGGVKTIALGKAYTAPVKAAFVVENDSTLWVGAEGASWREHALVADSIQLPTPTNARTATLRSLPLIGPCIDRAYFLRFEGEELLAAAGRLDPTEQDATPQIAMRLVGDEWSLFEMPNSQGGYTGSSFQWATSVARHPLKPTEYVVTTARTGIYDYTNLRIRQQQSYHNSPLVSALGKTHAAAGNYTRIDGALFDAQGNLFLLNNQADTALWVRKADGTWRGLYLEAISRAPALEKTFFDSRHRLWITSRRTVSNHNGGFLCLDFNNTIDNTADDLSTYRSVFTNQDGSTFTFQAAYALAEDRDGSLWLGTDQGLLRVDATADWHAMNFRITQVKVPREDGSGLADYLMEGVPITALAIDGAGRKWVGTQNDGLYLLSADGLSVVQHFTPTNSPLYSDNIWSLAIHPTTGEVFIGTDQGLLSYRSDASPAAETLIRSAIRVYPNPLRPEHRGTITIEGLTHDCELRIATAAGVVVASGRSLGGKFEWDGRDFEGNRVGSGVYAVYLYNASGNQALAAKLAIVR